MGSVGGGGGIHSRAVHAYSSTCLVSTSIHRVIQRYSINTSSPNYLEAVSACPLFQGMTSIQPNAHTGQS